MSLGAASQQPNHTFTLALHTLADDLKKSLAFITSHPLLSTSALPPAAALENATAYSNDLPGALLGIYTRARNFDWTTLSLDDIGAFASATLTFLTTPRLDSSTYLTALAALCTLVFLTMSWFGNRWGTGRFSPFGRGGSAAGSSEVNDADFSYITNADLAAHSQSQSQQSQNVDGDKNPDRDTDILLFKHGRTTYPTHFPAHSIRSAELSIGTIRAAAAKKLGIADPRRVRMLFKGRTLKNDDRTALEEGLRGDGNGSEILCVVGDAQAEKALREAAVHTAARGGGGGGEKAWSEDEDEEDNTDGEGEGDGESGAGAAGVGADGKKKKRSRKRGGRKGKKKTSSSSTPTPGLAYSSATPSTSEFLPMPSNARAPPSSGPTTQPTSRAPTPQTPIQKLDALASKFHTQLVPLCIQYLSHPPADEAKRKFEQKKLSETILTQILLKVDGVETEGEQEARMRRKELVREVNGMLNRLDEVVKE